MLSNFKYKHVYTLDSFWNIKFQYAHACRCNLSQTCPHLWPPLPWLGLHDPVLSLIYHAATYPLIKWKKLHNENKWFTTILSFLACKMTFCRFTCTYQINIKYLTRYLVQRPPPKKIHCTYKLCVFLFSYSAHLHACMIFIHYTTPILKEKTPTQIWVFFFHFLIHCIENIKRLSYKKQHNPRLKTPLSNSARM